MFIRRKKFQKRIERAIQRSGLDVDTIVAVREVGRTSKAFRVGDFGPDGGEQFETCPLTQAGRRAVYNYGALGFACAFDDQFWNLIPFDSYKVIG